MGSGRSPDDQPSGSDEPAPGEPDLSELERRILRLLSAPYRGPSPERVPASNKSIADALGLTVDKVRTHLKQLYVKFKVGTTENLLPSQKRHRLAETALELDLADEGAAEPPAARPVEPAASPTAEPPAAAAAEEAAAAPAEATVEEAAEAAAATPAEAAAAPAEEAAAAAAAPPADPVPPARAPGARDAAGDDDPAPTAPMPARVSASPLGGGRLKAGVAVGVAAAALVALALVLLPSGDSTRRVATTRATVATPPASGSQALVLVDVSRTMSRPLDRRRPQDGTRMAAARELAQAAVADIGAPDEIGVWLMSSSREGLPGACRGSSAPCELQPLVSASDDVLGKLRPQLAGLRANAGDTPLYEVVERGVRTLRDSRAPARAIRSLVVVTDGPEQARRAGAVALAAGTGRGPRVQLFVVAAGRRLCDGASMQVVRASFPSRCYEATSLARIGAALRGVLAGVRRRLSPQRVIRVRSDTRRPCPDAKIRVPNVVGKNHQLAQDTMQAAGLLLLTERDASGRERRLIFDRDWTTIRQSPLAGRCVTAATIVLLTAKRDER